MEKKESGGEREKTAIFLVFPHLFIAISDILCHNHSPPSHYLAPIVFVLTTTGFAVAAAASTISHRHHHHQHHRHHRYRYHRCLHQRHHSYHRGSFVWRSSPSKARFSPSFFVYYTKKSKNGDNIDDIKRRAKNKTASRHLDHSNTDEALRVQPNSSFPPELEHHPLNTPQGRGFPRILYGETS